MLKKVSDDINLLTGKARAYERRCEMKKLLFCAAAVGCVAGLVKYMDKNGVPILGNLTMNLPVKSPVDPYDMLLKGIHFAESKNIVI